MSAFHSTKVIEHLSRSLLSPPPPISSPQAMMTSSRSPCVPSRRPMMPWLRPSAPHASTRVLPRLAHGRDPFCSAGSRLRTCLPPRWILSRCLRHELTVPTRRLTQRWRLCLWPVHCGAGWSSMSGASRGWVRRVAMGTGKNTVREWGELDGYRPYDTRVSRHATFCYAPTARVIPAHLRHCRRLCPLHYSY